MANNKTTVNWFEQAGANGENILHLALSKWLIDDVAVNASAADLNGISTAKTDFQQFVSIQSVIAASAGTWTKTRIAQGNYAYRHTPANDTSILGVDLTPIIRVASLKGFKLDGINVVYSIGSLALDAHSATLDLITYDNNAAVSVASVPLSGTLATATNASPYVTSLAVTTPAFDVTANTKYVFELTVDAAATSAYDYYGLMLTFTRNDS
jgi:hypothetical protein